DAGRRLAVAAGERALHLGVFEELWFGGRCGAVGSGGAGGGGVVVEVRVSGGRCAGDSGVGVAGVGGGGGGGGEGLGVVGGVGHARVDSAARGGQAVFDAGGGCVFDHGVGDGGEGEAREGQGEGG